MSADAVGVDRVSVTYRGVPVPQKYWNDAVEKVGLFYAAWCAGVDAAMPVDEPGSVPSPAQRLADGVVLRKELANARAELKAANAQLDRYADELLTAHRNLADMTSERDARAGQRCPMCEYPVG